MGIIVIYGCNKDMFRHQLGFITWTLHFGDENKWKFGLTWGALPHQNIVKRGSNIPGINRTSKFKWNKSENVGKLISKSDSQGEVEESEKHVSGEATFLVDDSIRWIKTDCCMSVVSTQSWSRQACKAQETIYKSRSGGSLTKILKLFIPASPGGSLGEDLEKKRRIRKKENIQNQRGKHSYFIHAGYLYTITDYNKQTWEYSWRIRARTVSEMIMIILAGTCKKLMNCCMPNGPTGQERHLHKDVNKHTWSAVKKWVCHLQQKWAVKWMMKTDKRLWCDHACTRSGRISIPEFY